MQQSPDEITIKDIARICGVGVSTVSRAINNHSDINPETKEAILEAIEKYGYVPNNSARNLKRTDGKSIAILVKGISNPFFFDMIGVIEEKAQKRGYSTVLRHVEFEENEVDVAIELIKEKRLNGIIFLGGMFTGSEEKLNNLSIPFVIDTAGNSPVNLDKSKYSSFTVDDEKEGYKVTDYLIKQGHKDIAIFCGELGNASVGQLRLNGYKRALEENHLPVREELIFPMKEGIEYYTLANGYANMKELLDSKTKVSAVFAISDIIAIGAMRAIADHGLSIPKDISIVGFDGIEYGEYMVPSLTTLKQPVLDIAYESSDLLFDLIDEKAKNQHRIFEGELIVRESTSHR